MSVTWQLAPVQFGVQKKRGREMGRGTHLGFAQWVLVVVVDGDSGGGGLLAVSSVFDGPRFQTFEVAVRVVTQHVEAAADGF